MVSNSYCACCGQLGSAEGFCGSCGNRQWAPQLVSSEVQRGQPVRTAATAGPGGHRIPIPVSPPITDGEWSSHPPAHVLAAVAKMDEPRVGVMWANVVMFWWIFPAIFLVYLTVRNVSWAVVNERPYWKYLAPIITLVVGFGLLLIFNSLVGSSQPHRSYYYNDY